MDGPPKIIKIVLVPNPNPNSIAVDLAAPADSLTLKIWTQNLALRAVVRLGAAPAGWSSLALGQALDGLPNGTYFMTAQAQRGDMRSPRSAPVTFVLLR